MKVTLNKAVLVYMLAEALLVLIVFITGCFRIKYDECIEIETAKKLIEAQAVMLLILIPVGIGNIVMFIACLVNKKWKTSLAVFITGIVLLILFLISVAMVSVSF